MMSKNLSKNNFKTFLEKNRNTRNLVLNSDTKRKERAKNVDVFSLFKYTPSTTSDDKPLLKGWKRWEATMRSQEEEEDRDHDAYVILNSNDNVVDVFCSCADFQFLWRYALTQKDMASWETYPEYKDIETHAPHTQEPSHITNPLFQTKLCKHLIKLFDIVEI